MTIPLKGRFFVKIAICDDDETIRNQLRGFICRYAGENTLDYKILEFSKSDSLLEQARQDPDIGILFLDIYMSPVSGMDLAETLRAEGNSCSIIFVTVSTDHYARSYEVDAEHYLVKPITYERVCQALSRCRDVLASSARCACFLSGGREILVPLKDIRYVEVFRNQTIVHAGRDITLRSTLETVAGQISDSRFLRTHRSFLLNMDYIDKRCGCDIYLKTGEKIPLSRTCEKIFEREYGRFLTASMTGTPL